MEREYTLSTKTIYDGKIIKVECQEVRLEDGNTSKREIVRHNGAVAVIAFLDEERIILVKQFRKALDDFLLEIPAGKIEKGEKLELCARRELEEETGYIPGELEYLGKIVTSPGFCDEIIHIYKATNLQEGVKGGDDDEFVEVYEIEISELKKKIKNGEIIDGKTISALSML